MSSLSCPVNLDTKKLQTAVVDMYARVAREPDGEFHFHCGPVYATQLLGYDRRELADIVVQDELTDSIRDSYELWAA